MPRSPDVKANTPRPRNSLGHLDRGRFEGYFAPGNRLLTLSAVGVILYSLGTLWFVLTAGDIGVRCVLGYRVMDVVPAHYQWQRSPSPELGARLAAEKAAWSDGPPHPGHDHED